MARRRPALTHNASQGRERRSVVYVRPCIATMPGVTGGQYFGPQGWQELKGAPGLARFAAQALDADVAAKLWTASEKLTGVAFG